MPGLAPAVRTPSVLFAEFCWPGVARQQVTFFCFAKRKSPKKRRPYWLRPFASLRATCGARFRRGLAKFAFGSDNAIPDPPEPPLLGPARTGQSGTGTEDRNTKNKPRQTRTRQGESLWFSVLDLVFPPHPLWMRRGAEVQADQGSRCLSRRRV